MMTETMLAERFHAADRSISLEEIPTRTPAPAKYSSKLRTAVSATPTSALLAVHSPLESLSSHKATKPPAPLSNLALVSLDGRKETELFPLPAAPAVNAASAAVEPTPTASTSTSCLLPTTEPGQSTTWPSLRA